jgi:hypothetical protein
MWWMQRGICGCPASGDVRPKHAENAERGFDTDYCRFRVGPSGLRGSAESLILGRVTQRYVSSVAST